VVKYGKAHQIFCKTTVSLQTDTMNRNKSACSAPTMMLDVFQPRGIFDASDTELFDASSRTPGRWRSWEPHEELGKGSIAIARDHRILRAAMEFTVKRCFL
jgi:hypothetical protein